MHSFKLCAHFCFKFVKVSLLKFFVKLYIQLVPNLPHLSIHFLFQCLSKLLQYLVPFNQLLIEMSDAINKLLPKSIELRPLQLRTQLLPIVRHVLQVGFPGHHGTQSSYLFVNPALYRLYKAVMCTFVALSLQYLLNVDLAYLVNSRIHHHLLVRLGLHGLIEELQLHFPLHCDLKLLDVSEYLGDLLVRILPMFFVPRFLFT